MTGRDPMEYGWWPASRASGIVALALISLSVTLGLAMAGRVTRDPKLRRGMIAVHEHAALAALIAIAVHGTTLLGDRWLDPGPLGIVVPSTWTTSRSTPGSGSSAATSPPRSARRSTRAELVPTAAPVLFLFAMRVLPQARERTRDVTGSGGT